MTDIFISYKREDRTYAHAIAEMFAGHGYDVWWDIDLLPGQKFADEINAVIKRTKVAIVLWTPKSVLSDWVKAEASLAMGREILIPAWLEKADLPAPYNTLQTLDITSWDGSPDHPILEGLLTEVRRRIGKPKYDRKELNKEQIKDVLEKPAHEAEFWSSISNRSPQSVDEYRSYLKNFGNDGSFAELAEIRIRELLKKKSGKKQVSFTTMITLSGVLVGIIVGLFQITDMLGWIREEKVVATAESTEPPQNNNPSKTEHAIRAKSAHTPNTDPGSNPQNEPPRDEKVVIEGQSFAACGYSGLVLTPTNLGRGIASLGRKNGALFDPKSKEMILDPILKLNKPLELSVDCFLTIVDTHVIHEYYRYKILMERRSNK